MKQEIWNKRGAKNNKYDQTGKSSYALICSILSGDPIFYFIFQCPITFYYTNNNEDNIGGNAYYTPTLFNSVTFLKCFIQVGYFFLFVLKVVTKFFSFHSNHVTM